MAMQPIYNGFKWCRPSESTTWDADYFISLAHNIYLIDGFKIHIKLIDYILKMQIPQQNLSYRKASFISLASFADFITLAAYSPDQEPTEQQESRVIFIFFLCFFRFAVKQRAFHVVSSSVESSVDSSSDSLKVLKPLPFVLLSQPFSTDLQNSCSGQLNP